MLTFPVSYIKNYDPKVNGNITGLLSEVTTSPRKTIVEGVTLFSLAFGLAPLLIYPLISTLGFFPPIILITFLIIGSVGYVKGKERNTLETLMALTIIGLGSILVFAYAKQVHISNPVYTTSFAIFFPWERLVNKSRRTKPVPPEKLERNLDLFVIIPFLTLLSGWNASISAYLLPNKNGNPSSEELLSSGAVSEGFALGTSLVISSLDLSKIGGYSSILEPLKGAAIPIEDHLSFIALAVPIGSFIALALSQINFGKFYQSKESQFLSYGIMFGTMTANAGWFSIPIILIGFLVHILLRLVGDSDPLKAYRDPSFPNRTKTTLFIYPILFL